MPYAVDYTGITALGLPFYILSVGGNHVVRADRSPTYSMTCIMIGAIINTILDPVFIFVFGWGIKGGCMGYCDWSGCFWSSGYCVFLEIPKYVSDRSYAETEDAISEGNYFVRSCVLH